MNDIQKQILVNIYEQSKQGINPIALGNSGNFLIDTQEQKIYFENLKTLQNDEYIKGIPHFPEKKNGLDFYLLSNITITKKGIEFSQNLTDSVYTGSNSWLLSHNDYTQKDNKIYLAYNPNQNNNLISIAQIYNEIESLNRPILNNLIEKREEENLITYIIKKPLMIMSEGGQIWNNDLLFSFKLKKNEYWRDEMSQDLKNRFGYEGKDFRTIFEKNIEICCNFKSQIHFIDCIFKDRLSIMEDATIIFSNKVIFTNCKFHSKVNFSNSTFETDVTFHKSKFNAQVNFQGVMFQGNAYFSESIFAEKANFSRGKFEKTAGFYGTTFEKVPNFSQAIFKGNLNLVNTNLNFDFEDVEKKIKEEYSNHIGTEKEKFLDKFANDFRDSFRLFKNALIKENNLLDAANHHRIELYCKEIELESKKPKIFSRDWIDKWILKFYRHTSDHHTDLLKIWHSLLIVVGIFGILSSGVIVAFDYGYLKFCDFSAHSLIEMYNAHINHFVLTHSYEMLGMNALLFMLFIGLFMLGVLWDRARVIGICISYCVTILLFAASPKYLIPAIGIFTDKRSMLDPLSVIGGIYTIVFAFMLYSFIKTARKNSIIPH